MFLLNSCLGQFSAACSRRRPFSRSYGAILPNSLTMLLPPALGFSPHLPVSVCGTGLIYAIAAFPDSHSACFATLLFAPLHASALQRGFPFAAAPALAPVFPFPAHALCLCHHISGICGYRNLNLLSIGYDLPRADQLYPGNLRYSAERIPTFLSLLIPAFSLHCAPPPLPVWLLRPADAPLPIFSFDIFHSFGGVFQPRTFSAQGLSTSELLRTL